jgi:hypothetical protein
VRRTSLHAHAGPPFEGFLQPGVAIDHQQERCREAALLQAADHPAPGGLGFGGGDAQIQQAFLAVFRDAERRQHRNGDDAPGHAHLQVEAVQEDDGIALGGEVTALPGRKQRLEPGDDPRDRVRRAYRGSNWLWNSWVVPSRPTIRARGTMTVRVPSGVVIVRSVLPLR